MPGYRRLFISPHSLLCIFQPALAVKLRLLLPRLRLGVPLLQPGQDGQFALLGLVQCGFQLRHPHLRSHRSATIMGCLILFIFALFFQLRHPLPQLFQFVGTC